MPYIGKQLSHGNYLKLDDISSSFNGSTTTFSLTNGGSAYYPGSELSILVSVGGVIQEPESAYQINNDEITFANAPTAQDSFFCIVLGDAIGINVPGNNTVNGAQMAKPFNYDGGLLYLNDTDNRVGINSTSPSVALDVVGDLNVSGNLVTGIGGTLGGAFQGNIYASSGISTFNDVLVSGDLTVQGDTTTLNTTLRNVELLRVSAASTLPAGIITQTNSGDILSLRDSSTEVFKVADGGNVTSSGDIFINVRGQSFKTSDWNIANTTSGNALSISGGNSAAEKIRIKNDGSVGIGTVVPNAPLQINHASPKIILEDNDNGADLSIANIGGAAVYSSASDAVFQTSDTTEMFRIGSTGNVYFSGNQSGNNRGILYNASGYFGMFASSSSGVNRELRFFRSSSASSEVMRLVSSGITLHSANGGGTIYGDDGATGELILRSASGNVNHSRIDIGVNEGSDNGGVHFYTAGSTVAERRITIKGTNGRVGIGTHLPLAGLHLSDGTAYGSPQITNQKAQLIISAGTETTANMQFLASSYNHIFFGTSSDANAGGIFYHHTGSYTNSFQIENGGCQTFFRPSGSLDIRSTDAQGNSFMQSFLIKDSGNNAQYQIGMYQNNTQHLFINNMKGDVRIAHASNDHVTFTSDGKVGIGTNLHSPSFKLDVREALAVAYSATASPTQLGIANINSSAATNFSGIHMYSDGNGRGVVNLNCLNNSTNASADFTIQTRHSGTLAERLRIKSTGKVGINLDDNTTADLQVCTPNTAHGLLRIGGNNTNGVGIDIDYSNSGHTKTTFKQNYRSNQATAEMSFESGFFTFISGTGSDERLRIDSSGRLLVSGQAALTSTSLNHPIQVAAASDATSIAIFGRAADDIAELDFYENDKTTKLGELQYRQDHLNLRHRVGYISFATGGVTERLNIASDGVARFINPTGELKIASSTGNDGGKIILQENTLGAWSLEAQRANGFFRISDEYNNNAGSPQEYFRISTNGRVSISDDGTTDGLLTIKGNSDATSNPSIRLLDGSDTREVSISNQSGDLIMSTHGTDNAAHGEIKIFDSGLIHLNTDGANTRLAITTAGRVGINQSSPDAASLHIGNSYSSTSSNVALQVGTITGQNRYLTINHFNNQQNFNSLKMRVNDNAKVAMINMGNPFAGVGYGSQILFHGPGDAQAGGIEVVNQNSTGANSKMVFRINDGSTVDKECLQLQSNNDVRVYNGLNIAKIDNDSSNFSKSGLVLSTPTYNEYHYVWGDNGTGGSGQAAYKITMTCGSYFHSEFIYTQHQTNGGNQMHTYARGKWANNHVTHTGYMYEFSGAGSGLTHTFTVSDQNDNGTVDLKSGLTAAGAAGATYRGFYGGGSENTSSGTGSATGKFVIDETRTYDTASTSTRGLIIRVYFGSFSISKSTN